jgi:branched-chain amino acid transport system substrate-binding protein
VCAWLLAACGGERPVPTVGVAGLLGHPAVIAVAQAHLADSGIDSTMLRFHVSVSGDGLAGEVRRAAELARVPGLAVVVGHVGSRGTLLAAPIYGDAGIPVVVPTGTSRRLRTAGAHVFTMAPDDSLEGEFIVDFVRRRLGAESVTVVYAPDEYGLGVRAGVEAAAALRSIRVVDAIPVSVNDCRGSRADPYALAARASLRRGRPAALIVATSSTIAGCVVRAFRAEQAGLRVVMADGAAPTQAFLDVAGSAADSSFFVAFWHSDLDSARSSAFRTRFRLLTGRAPEASEVVWYDALRLAADAALTAAGRPARARDYLARLGEAQPFHGLAGTIAFTPRRSLPLVMTLHAGGVTAMVAP